MSRSCPWKCWVGIAIAYALGIMPGIKSFIAAVLGGIGIIHGAVLGGLIIGVSEVFVSAFLSSTLRDGVIFFILFLVLLLKPSGIFGMVGIKNGDVLLRINDFAIDSPDKAIQSLVSLKGQNRIKLDLIRDGQPTTFTYDIR